MTLNILQYVDFKHEISPMLGDTYFPSPKAWPWRPSSARRGKVPTCWTHRQASSSLSAGTYCSWPSWTCCSFHLLPLSAATHTLGSAVRTHCWPSRLPTASRDLVSLRALAQHSKALGSSQHWGVVVGGVSPDQLYEKQIWIMCYPTNSSSITIN